MSFRRKIFLVVFLAGLLPSLVILLIAASLLNSTIDRIGAAGFENSVRSASSLVNDSEKTLGVYLNEALKQPVDWHNSRSIEKWMSEFHLDLVFKAENGRITNTKISGDKPETFDDIKGRIIAPGLFHLEHEGYFFLCYSLGDSLTSTGCGIMMSSGYAEKGRSLSEALSAAAGLEIYKGFSLKLLALVTGIMAVLTLIVGFILSTILSRRLVKPLEMLTEGAGRIGRGDLDFKVELSGGDEFVDLAGSFNTMASSIKENQTKLLAAERLAAWRDVARRIAHEIRNPLTPITVELYRLRQKISESNATVSEDVFGSLDAIDAQIRALQDLSGQFSLFAKEPDLKKIKCDVGEIIEQSVSLYVNRNNVNLKTDIGEDIPSLDLDPRMMGRLFNNLIKNSVEASTDKIAIEITVKLIDNIVKIDLRDNGPGFPAEKLEKIDQPYITTKSCGTGLGLAISKKIVEEHGGTIRFFNDNGAVAELILPIGS
ncbi:MAG: ATP-binding protein [candidate division Zixibacteria bacterium]